MAHFRQPEPAQDQLPDPVLSPSLAAAGVALPVPLAAGVGPSPLPAAPAFGHRSIAEVLTSAAASLGVPGFENKLNLPPAKRVCVVLADGLGRNLLKQKIAHTPFLRDGPAGRPGPGARVAGLGVPVHHRGIPRQLWHRTVGGPARHGGLRRPGSGSGPGSEHAGQLGRRRGPADVAAVPHRFRKGRGARRCHDRQPPAVQHLGHDRGRAPRRPFHHRNHLARPDRSGRRGHGRRRALADVLLCQ